MCILQQQQLFAFFFSLLFSATFGVAGEWEADWRSTLSMWGRKENSGNATNIVLVCRENGVAYVMWMGNGDDDGKMRGGGRLGAGANEADVRAVTVDGVNRGSLQRFLLKLCAKLNLQLAVDFETVFVNNENPNRIEMRDVCKAIFGKATSKWVGADVGVFFFADSYGKENNP